MKAARPVVMLALASLALRLAMVPYFASKPLFSDFQVYASDAQRIARGEAILEDPELANRSPAYPLLLAGLIRLFGASLELVYVLQALGWVAAGLLTWTWSRKALGSSASLFAAASVLFHPDGIIAFGLTGVESLATLLLVALMLRFTRACEERLTSLDAFLDGILAGAAALTVATFGLLVALSLFAVACVRIRRNQPIRRLLLVPLAAMLVLSPWILRNAVVLGAFVPLTTISGSALLGGNNPRADGEWNQDYVAERRRDVRFSSEMEWNCRARREVLQFIAHEPGRWALLEMKKVARFLSPKPGSFYRHRFFHPALELVASPLCWMPLMFLFPLGVARARTEKPEILLATAAIASLFMVTLVFFALVRYRIPYLPAFSLLAAAGLDRILAMRTSGGASRRFLVAIAVWSIVLSAGWSWILLAEWGKVLTWLYR